MNGKGHKKKWDSKVLSISTMNDKYKICFEGEKEKGKPNPSMLLCPIFHSHRFPINLFFLKTNLFKGEMK